MFIFRVISLIAILGYTIFIGIQLYSNATKYHNQIPVTVEIQKIGELRQDAHNGNYTLNLNVIYKNGEYQYDKMLYPEEVSYFLEHIKAGDKISAYYDTAKDMVGEQVTQETLTVLVILLGIFLIIIVGCIVMIIDEI